MRKNERSAAQKFLKLLHKFKKIPQKLFFTFALAQQQMLKIRCVLTAASNHRYFDINFGSF